MVCITIIRFFNFFNIYINEKIFFMIDDQKKRKIENESETESPKTPPSKQKKLDNDSQSLVTPPQSPCIQLIENVNNFIFLLNSMYIT